MLAEWHVTPEYILDNWTDEQFQAFWDARNNRIRAINELVPAAPAAPGRGAEDNRSRRVSDMELFAMMKINPSKSARA